MTTRGFGQAAASMFMPDAPHHPHARRRGVEGYRHGDGLALPAGVWRQRFVCLRTQDRYLRRGGAAHTGQEIAAVNRPEARQAPAVVLDAHLQAVLQQAGAQPARQARRQLAPPRRTGKEDDVRRGRLTKPGQRAQAQVGRRVLQQRVIDEVDSLSARFQGFRRNRRQVVSDQPDRQFSRKALL